MLLVLSHCEGESGNNDLNEKVRLALFQKFFLEPSLFRKKNILFRI